MRDFGRLVRPPHIDSLSPRQRSLAFFTLVVALVLEIVDLTIVNTALPAIQTDLRMGAAHAQWLVAGYSLSFAVLLILGGKLGDLVGPRRMFLIGVGGFTLASLLCGAAATPDQLVAARVLQGATGAIMGPQVLALIQVLYDPVERIGRLSWFGVIGGLSAIAGPILGGLLISADVAGLGWRPVFLINGPVGVAAVVAGLRWLPKPAAVRREGLDLVGALGFGLALAMLLYPLVRGERPAFSLIGWTLLALSGLCAALGWRRLVRRAGRSQAVIFDPALLAERTFRQGLVVAVTFAAANTGFLFIFAYTLQRVLGYSALQTGLIHVPFSVGVMFGIGFVGRRFLARAGKRLVVAGAVLMAFSCGVSLVWIMAGDASVGVLVAALVAAGVGMGMLSGPIAPIAVARVAREHAGAASGILKTVQQAGAAVGVAVVGSAYFAFSDQAPTQGVGAALIAIEALILLCAVFGHRLPKDIFQAPQT